MENASKALIMAGGVLISLIIIALLVIFVSDEGCSVGDLIQLAPCLPGVGYIYNSNGDCAIT